LGHGINVISPIVTGELETGVGLDTTIVGPLLEVVGITGGVFGYVDEVIVGGL
jgi:hypothetical protein